MGISEKLGEITARISAAEKRSGRVVGSCRLIGVSKTKPLDLILEGRKAGIEHFGENYVQEAVEKIETIRKIEHGPEALNTTPNKIFWHMIGALQTNKVKLVVGSFSLIHSVDRPNLAKAISKQAKILGVDQKILLEVNVADEPTKGGVSPKDLKKLLTDCLALPNLLIEGLMCIPPLELEVESSRRHFKKLKDLRDELKSLVPAGRGSFNELSMGTTHDFEVAIEEGATFVRVGTALFGERERK